MQINVIMGGRMRKAREVGTEVGIGAEIQIDPDWFLASWMVGTCFIQRERFRQSCS